MLERNILPRKLSFVVLIWITIFAVLFTTVSIPAHQIVSLPTLNEFISDTIKFMPDLTKYIEASPTQVRANDLQCMAENIYHEAATQSYVGKLAVGEVVLNRIKSPGYPSTVCGVIKEGSKSSRISACQFSWFCDKNTPNIDYNSQAWNESATVAYELLKNGNNMVDVTEGATSYHADYVNPDWAKRLQKVTQIDQHIFYRVP